VNSAVITPNICGVDARLAAARCFERKTEMSIVGGTKAAVRAKLSVGAAELHVRKTVQGHGA